MRMLLFRTEIGRHGARFLPWLAVVALMLFPGPGSAQARPAMTSIVIDQETGAVLLSQGADSENQPASLAKMMTLYLLFERIEAGGLSMSSTIRVSQRAAGMPPSKLGLKPGSSIAVRDAVNALIVKSANDIAVAVAETLAGSESAFAQRMTARARELGMRSTTFKNASGLPDRRQITTARDMAKLANRMNLDFPQHYHLFANRSFRFAGRTYRSHNQLLGEYRGMDGLKTGYVRASGFNLAASAERDGRRLIGIVLGGRTAAERNARMARILDAGFVRAAERGLARSVPKPVAAPRIDSVRPLARPESDKPPFLPAARPVLVASAEAVAAELPSDAGSASGGEDRMWGVQVGAFAARDTAIDVARRASRTLPGLLGDAEIASPRSLTGSKLYLARLVGMDRDLARDACIHLENARFDCMVFRVR